MALLDSELDRLRTELGYPLLTSAAEPYVGITSLFTQVIQPYLSAGAITTSATTVVASSPPALTAITLTSPTGFAAGARVVIDVDVRQETVTVESLSGSVLSALTSLAHSGVYNLTVEGGESIIREYLRYIRDVKAQMALAFGTGALKAVDEIQWYDVKGAQTLFGNLGDQLMYWRTELASALGIRSMWAYRSAGAGRLSVY